MLHTVNITIHVLAAIVAIFIASIAYATEKGGATHRRYGRIFLGLMGIVIITALNGVLFFRDRPFLTIVTLLSFYTSYSGYRVLKTKARGFQWVDFVVMLMVLALATSFVIRIKSANVVWPAAVVYYMLAYVFAIVGFDMLRYAWPTLIRHQRFWVYDHIFKMTASFTALISAGVGTVLTGVGPYAQIVPAILATGWLVFCLVYFAKYARTNYPLKTNAH